MIESILKSAYRALRKHRIYAAINVLGLALGIAASLLIGQYVAHELSYDTFHEERTDIYRVRFDLFREGERLFKCATTYPAVGPALQADFPEVEAYTRLFLRYGGGVVRVEDRSYKEEGVFHADSTFLTMFSYPWLKGDQETALSAPHTVVLSERAAIKYFGDDDPIGQRIRFGSEEEYTVTGVMQSPDNSHLSFNLLFSFATLEQLAFSSQSLEDYAWNWYDFYTYVRLRPTVRAEGFEAKLPAFMARHKSAEAATREVLSLQPLADIHLTSDLIQEARPNGNATTVYLLAVIAGFILVIAWVNYVNLETARATERAREVGVRKSVGASRRQLIGQFLTESMLLNVGAALIALVGARIALPWFSDLVGVPLTFTLLGEPAFWVGFVLICGLGAVIAGLYPAFVLASYQPARVLKGHHGSLTQGLSLRRGLIVGQFAASIGLIAATLVVYQQLSYMQSQDLGVDINQMLVVEAPEIVQSDSLHGQQIQSFVQEAERLSAIEQASASTEIPGNLVYWASGMRPYGGSSGASTVLYQIGTDDDYLETYGHRLLAGRALRTDTPADTSRVVLNVRAVRALGFAGPDKAVGKRIVGGPDTLEVAGVVADYHQQGLHRPADPVGFRMLSSAQRYQYVTLKGASRQWGDTVAEVQAVYERFFPDDPFTFVFLDEYFGRQYRSYERFGQVFSLFAAFAIIVACLGLFGLASFMTAQRTKEIGIRKALGATVSGIVALLTKDFLRLIVLSGLIAAPFVWLGMHRWLDQFAYRTSVQGTTFLVATGLVLVVALLTVGGRAFRAARIDPTECLRTE